MPCLIDLCKSDTQLNVHNPNELEHNYPQDHTRARMHQSNREIISIRYDLNFFDFVGTLYLRFQIIRKL